MSTNENDNKVVVLGQQAARPASVMPVTRLVSRPSIRIVDGVLVAVKEMVRSAA